MDRGSTSEDINPRRPRSMVASMGMLEAGSGREWFLIWKAQVSGILQRAGLWDVVDPDQNVASQGLTPDGVHNDAFFQWKRAKAREIIHSAVAFEMVCNSDPRECWIYLQKTFAPNTAVQGYECMWRLWNLRMQDDEKVPEFRSRVQHVLDHLRGMGVVADEQLLVLLLIDALPRSWRLAAAAYRREAEYGTTLQTTAELFMAMRRQEIHFQMTAQAMGLDPVQGEVLRQEV